MGTRDTRIDAYIGRSAPFAQPILTYLRDVIHEACPEVQESFKWSAPTFEYKGILCNFGAFKEHCTFGFWKGELVVGDAAREGAAGQFGRITSMKGLPAKRVLVQYIRKAKKLNDEGVPAPRAARARTPRQVVVPDELAKAFRKNKRAAEGFRELSPSHQREYCEWIAEAKRDETRARRVEQTIDLLKEGKSLNAKYARM